MQLASVLSITSKLEELPHDAIPTLGKIAYVSAIVTMLNMPRMRVNPYSELFEIGQKIAHTFAKVFSPGHACRFYQTDLVDNTF